MKAGFVKGESVALFRYSILVLVLGIGVVLAMSSPTMEDYLRFIEVEMIKVLDQSDPIETNRERAMIKSIFASHSHEIVDSVVRPRTVRRNWGLAALFETSIHDSRILVLGVGGRFIPLSGKEEMILQLGRMAF